MQIFDSILAVEPPPSSYSHLFPEHPCHNGLQRVENIFAYGLGSQLFLTLFGTAEVPLVSAYEP